MHQVKEILQVSQLGFSLFPEKEEILEGDLEDEQDFDDVNSADLLTQARGVGRAAPLDGLLTLAFIAPSFWTLGTKASTRAATIRRALGVVDVDYNRLEWLGDSVLELLVREHLVMLRPGSDEGQLTQMATAIVSTQGCAAILRCLRLDRFVLQGNVTLRDQEVEKINADVLEALLGALMLGAGFDVTRRVFRTALLPAITTEAERLLAAFPIRERVLPVKPRRRRR